jgi:hypothetical protein
MRGEERELKEIVGVFVTPGRVQLPNPRPTLYNRSGIWGIPIARIAPSPAPSLVRARPRPSMGR